MALLNGTGTQVTSVGAKPSTSAMARAVAASKPLPLFGSPSSHGSVAVSPSAGGWKYGGKAGLSAPIVSVPAVFVASDSLAQASAEGDGSTDAASLGAASLGAASLGD